MHFLRIIGIRAQALLSGLHQSVLGLEENLHGEVRGALVGFADQFFEELRGEHAGQHGDDQQHEAGHHQGEFCAQP